MLSVKDLRKTVAGGKVLLDGITFEVRAGEFVGVLGASGAGKTLTIRAVAGLTEATGEVRLEASGGRVFEMTQLRGRELRRARREIGVIFQGLQLSKRLSVLENVLIGRLGRVNPVRSWLYGFTDHEAEEAMATLEQVELAGLAARRTGTLSGGEQQRVAIARAMMQQPSLYLADEPVSSLDPKNAKAIMKLLRPLAERTPVIGAFHQPELTRRYCTRVIGMRAGRVVWDGSPDLTAEQLREIYGAELADVAAVAV